MGIDCGQRLQQQGFARCRQHLLNETNLPVIDTRTAAVASPSQVNILIEGPEFPIQRCALNAHKITDPRHTNSRR
jgi:hypothetical protein